MTRREALELVLVEVRHIQATLFHPSGIVECEHALCFALAALDALPEEVADDAT